LVAVVFNQATKVHVVMMPSSLMMLVDVIVVLALEDLLLEGKRIWPRRKGIPHAIRHIWEITLVIKQS